MFAVALHLVVCSVTLAHCFFLPPAFVEGSAGMCPSQQTAENVTTSIHAAISNILQNTVSSLPQCGEGRWYRVASFDAASDVCPSPWVLRNIAGNNACGRSVSPGQSCDSVSFFTGGLRYSKVCGRIVGRAMDTPDGFQEDPLFLIDEPYIDGVSITTLSTPRNHIWTFAVDHVLPTDCPCSTGRAEFDFIGSNYFCDYSPPSSGSRSLWDGEECVENTALTCCDFNSPPYFSADLTTPTSDDIEVRICANERRSNENILIMSMELYVK